MVRVSLREGETGRGINPTIPSRKTGRTESNAWDAPDERGRNVAGQQGGRQFGTQRRNQQSGAYVLQALVRWTKYLL